MLVPQIESGIGSWRLEKEKERKEREREREGGRKIDR